MNPPSSIHAVSHDTKRAFNETLNTLENAIARRVDSRTTSRVGAASSGQEHMDHKVSMDEMLTLAVQDDSRE